MKSGALRRGFSLMEMMVVLLIVAIIAAASAPMVTKKMSRNAGSADSPWIFTGLSNSIAYNPNGGNDIAIIGASSYNNNGGPTHPRLVLAAGNDTNHPPLAFADNTGKFSFQFNINPSTGTVAINDSTTTPSGSVALGFGQTLQNVPTDIIAIGNNTINGGVGSIAIGVQAKANNTNTIAIGNSAKTSPEDGMANSIAIGVLSESNEANSIAIGVQAKANHTNSVAIGKSVETTAPDQIVLGSPGQNVYIPGNLVVGKNAYIGRDITPVAGSTPLIMKTPQNLLRNVKYTTSSSYDEELKYGITSPVMPDPFSSDRRLKNVGKAYTAGLEDLKKLEFFHYTFKKDEAKTPHVGVMAQDLEKVFPDAVTKGDDGFLRIRWEDMFYAVINAVKELDEKISAVVKDVTGVQEIVKAQQEQIDELEKQNAELEKRIEKLEKELKKDKKD